ncbi:hypothetical protein JCM10212_004292 [Sporobolomyces blumeae]
MSDADPFDSVLSPETEFYHSGYSNGYPHGQLHGLFEGREFGRDHAWTTWEEIAYYEGVANVLKVVLERQGKAQSRSMQALDQILDLANKFPTSNDSSSLASPSSSASESTHEPHEGRARRDEVDMTAQLATIRSKYKTVCATMGIRARMSVAVAASAGGSTNASSNWDEATDTRAGGGDLKQMGMSL